MFVKALISVILLSELVFGNMEFSDYPKVHVLEFWKKIMTKDSKNEFETKKEYGKRISKLFGNSPIIYIYSNRDVDRSVKYDVEKKQMIINMDNGSLSVGDYFLGHNRYEIRQIVDHSDSKTKKKIIFNMPVKQAKKRKDIESYGYQYIVKLDLREYKGIGQHGYNQYIKDGIYKAHTLNFFMYKFMNLYVYDTIKKEIVYQFKK